MQIDQTCHVIEWSENQTKNVYGQKIQILSLLSNTGLLKVWFSDELCIRVAGILMVTV